MLDGLRIYVLVDDVVDVEDVERGRQGQSRVWSVMSG
jgi:hypothetical protein